MQGKGLMLCQYCFNGANRMGSDVSPSQFSVSSGTSLASMQTTRSPNGSPRLMKKSLLTELYCHGGDRGLSVLHLVIWLLERIQSFAMLSHCCRVGKWVFEP